ncbi:MAG: HAD family hydrolase [Anaerolineae bacterium]|nr:HAD family hydrolase [Anaerolineae bacterium]
MSLKRLERFIKWVTNSANRKLQKPPKGSGKRIVFLDRDGVLNVDRHVTYRLEQFELIAGVIEGLSLLQALGFEFIIVTNQSAVGRGWISEHDVDRFNQRLIYELNQNGIEITMERIYICPHDPIFGTGKYKKKCDCHKPRPGMFHTAADDYGLELTECYYIGDKMSDVLAGFNARCKTILVETGILDDIHEYPGVSPDVRVKDLPKAAHIISGELAIEQMYTTGKFVAPFGAEICAALQLTHQGVNSASFVYTREQVSKWQR